MLKEHILRQHAGWSGRSQVHLNMCIISAMNHQSLFSRSTVYYQDNEEMDVLRPKQCPNCREFNRPDQKL
jgi:integrase/recombinase XerD